jgi:Protein of unknown function (DUF2568)
MLHAANDLLAFLLELAVYAATGYCAYRRTPHRVARWVLAFAVPLALAVVWGLFGAPSAAFPAHGAARAVLEVGWFGAGAAALGLAVGRRALLAFVLAYLCSTLIAHV